MKAVLEIWMQERGCRITAYVDGERWPADREFIASIDGDPAEARRYALMLAVKHVGQAFPAAHIELVGPTAGA